MSKRSTRGERNGMAKYTEAQVREIATSTLRPKELAYNLKVNLKSVYDIRSGRAWNEITGKDNTRKKVANG